MIVSFDLETTGLDKFNDKIIEIAMIKFDKQTFKIIETYSCFIDPEIPIPEVISNITSIFDDDVKGAPKIKEIKEEILNFIGENPLLGHNIDFDVGFFLANDIDVSDNIKLDTFFLANFLTFDNNSLNLEMLCQHYKIPFAGAHRAVNDVKATINLFEAQLKDFNKLGKDKKNLIQYLFSISNDKNIKYLQDLLFGLFSENTSFLSFEKIILDKIGMGRLCEDFLNINNKNSKSIEMGRLCEDFSNKNIKQKKSIKCEDFVKIFKNMSNFSQKKEKIFKDRQEETIEQRENQIKMTEKVYEILTSGKKSLIEAPTGLGKSFAYLIPSIIYSVKNNEKVYISTKTKTLQDQLFFKDLEFLSEKLGINFSYSKLKGKRNYISLKRFFDYIILGNLTYEEVSFLSKISLWLLETKFGELEELNFFSGEYILLRDLNSEGIDYLNEKSKYREYEFLYKAKKALDNSNITIINHSLLFSSLEQENANLTNLKNLIIDEAHNIEDTVTESLKKTYSLKIFREYFEKFEKIFNLKNIKQIDFINKKNSLFSTLEVLDDYSISYLNNAVKEDNPYKTTLIKNNYFENLKCEDFVKKLNLDFLNIIDNLEVINEYDFSKEINFITEIAKFVNVFFDKNNLDKYIKIISFSENGGLIHNYTLLNPGEYLKDNLWNNLQSCVLTSATLSISNSFDYIKNILNLDDFEFYSFDSDFDYKEQAMLFIPTDIGNVKNNTDEIVEFLRDFFMIVKGNTLVLLTNFAIIKKIYTANNLYLKKNGINLYAQSIGGSKTKQISFYKKNPSNSILLGTDSFWEGIDIPGEDLKYLIIHKFPFQVPSDPIFQARSIFFKDSFKEYSVPKAIIKLKQGFGRLIRTKDDKGVVILLDDRINSDWGNKFYEAFPKEINIKKGTKKQFLEILEKK